MAKKININIEIIGEYINELKDIIMNAGNTYNELSDFLNMVDSEDSYEGQLKEELSKNFNNGSKYIKEVSKIPYIYSNIVKTLINLYESFANEDKRLANQINRK